MNPRLRRPAGALLAIALAASVLGITPAATAVEGGTITGTITDSTGAPLENVSVDVYDLQDGYWRWTSVDYATDTAVDGTYALALPPGDYRIGFDHYFDHVEEFYDDTATVEAAQTITVSSGSSFTADADLATASHVTGTVTGPDGLPRSDVNVTVYEEILEVDGSTRWQPNGNEPTDVNGAYNVGGLAPGTYRVGFESYLDAGLASEFYVDQPIVELAQDVEVPEGTLTGINAQLAEASQITGTVTDVNNAPIAGASVSAVVGVGDNWYSVSDTTTDAMGAYTIDGLSEGTYRIDFWYEAGDDYFYETWNNRARLEDGDDIIVGSDVTVAGKDAQLILGEHDTKYVEGVTIPTISGTPQVGSTLTVTAGTWSPADVTVAYQWFRGEQAIAGATASTYALTAADQGQYLWVEVLASYPGYENRYTMSNVVGPVAAAPVVAPAPAPVAPVPAPAPEEPTLVFPKKMKVEGALKVGKKLVLKKYEITLDGADVTYKIRWYAGKKQIKKATKPKLKLTRALKGKKISVKVTAKSGSTSKKVKIKLGKVR